MNFNQKKSSKSILSDKIADALTVKSRADIEDDHIFNTKPNTISRADYSSESEDETAISDFRKHNANLLSDISKKYQGKVVSRKELEDRLSSSDVSDVDNSDSSDGLPDKLKSLKQEFYNGKESKGSVNIQNKNILTKKEKHTKNFVGSADDCDESDDYSLATNQIKVLRKELPNKYKSISSEESDENDVCSEESDDYSIVKATKKVSQIKLPGQPRNATSDNDSEGNKDFNYVKKQIQENSDEHSDSSGEEEDEEENDEDEEDGEGYDISQLEQPVKEDFEHVKKQNISEEAKKGACVRNQLLIWENLLEMRIHMQRCMNTANMMPMSDKYEELRSCSQFVEESNITKNNVTNVLDKLLTLQNLLLQNFPETKSLCNKKQKDTTINKKDESDEEIPSDTDNEEIPSDTEPEDDIVQEKTKKYNTKANTTVAKKRKLEDYESDLYTSHKSFKTFRDSTIQKWNEKTRLATAANIKKTSTNTILQQISYILSDRNKLVRRTQLKRTDYDILGYSKSDNSEQNNDTTNNIEENAMTKDRKDNDEYIPEIFDDSDFYHQLLRELIECKSADISDPVQLSRQWITLQQMRSKMKRKVDTRATKGRKVKYVVHNPLVNYMAPVKSLKWNEESSKELYSSLFGKMFEHNNVGLNVDLENMKDK